METDMMAVGASSSLESAGALLNYLSKFCGTNILLEGEAGSSRQTLQGGSPDKGRVSVEYSRWRREKDHVAAAGTMPRDFKQILKLLEHVYGGVS